ncbi:MAG: hypothetical protein ABSG00_11635 [Terracidiphilus sp.]
MGCWLRSLCLTECDESAWNGGENCGSEGWLQKLSSFQFEAAFLRKFPTSYNTSG